MVPGSSPLHILSWKKGAEETKNNEIKFTRKMRMETNTDMVDSVIHQTVDNVFCYIDTVEMPGFLLLLKIISAQRTVKIQYLSFTCEDIGVAMVTNRITQLQ